MPEPTLHAGPVDLDALDAFLLSDRAPEASMGLSDLDGVLAGIAAGPELVMPNEWLPVVWGGAEPAFEGVDEARSVLGTIMGRHNEIVRALGTAPDEFDPAFWEGPDDGGVVVTDWAAGFLDAIMLRPKAWEPLVRHTEASALIVPLLVLGAEDPERLPFGVRPPPKEQIEALHAMGADLIPDCVVGIHGFWRERRAWPAAGAGGNGGRRPAGGAAPRRRR
jgi:uncharacterized protein